MAEVSYAQVDVSAELGIPGVVVDVGPECVKASGGGYFSLGEFLEGVDPPQVTSLDEMFDSDAMRQVAAHISGLGDVMSEEDLAKRLGIWFGERYAKDGGGSDSLAMGFADGSALVPYIRNATGFLYEECTGETLAMELEPIAAAISEAGTSPDIDHVVAAITACCDAVPLTPHFRNCPSEALAFDAAALILAAAGVEDVDVAGSDAAAAAVEESADDIGDAVESAADESAAENGPDIADGSMSEDDYVSDVLRRAAASAGFSFSNKSFGANGILGGIMNGLLDLIGKIPAFSSWTDGIRDKYWGVRSQKAVAGTESAMDGYGKALASVDDMYDAALEAALEDPDVAQAASEGGVSEEEAAKGKVGMSPDFAEHYELAWGLYEKAVAEGDSINGKAGSRGSELDLSAYERLLREMAVEASNMAEEAFSDACRKAFEDAAGDMEAAAKAVAEAAAAR